MKSCHGQLLEGTHYYMAADLWHWRRSALPHALAALRAAHQHTIWHCLCLQGSSYIEYHRKKESIVQTPLSKVREGRNRETFHPPVKPPTFQWTNQHRFRPALAVSAFADFQKNPVFHRVYASYIWSKCRRIQENGRCDVPGRCAGARPSRQRGPR